VIGLTNQDLGSEQEALRQILVAHKQRGTLDLVTSRVTEQEIQKGDLPGADEAIYLLLKDVPFLDEEELVPRPVRAGAGLKGPVVVEHPDFGRLRRMLPDENDARHLFQAISNGVEYFVTNDKATILRHSEEIEAAFPIRVLLPSQLVSELELGSVG
jgi:hypothetical protein